MGVDRFGADPNQGDQGVLPLMLAAKEGHVSLLQPLMEAGAILDPDCSFDSTSAGPLAKNSNSGGAGRNLLVKLKGTGRALYPGWEVVRGKRQDRIGKDDLLEDEEQHSTNARHADSNQSGSLPKVGSPEKGVAAGGRRLAFHAASERGGPVEFLELLLERGIHVDCADPFSHGASPLILACSSCALDCVSFLIRQSADVNFTDSKGDTPLLVATACDFQGSLVQLLLESKADPAQVNRAGSPALLRAAEVGNAKVCKLLLTMHSGDPNATNTRVLCFNCFA